MKKAVWKGKILAESDKTHFVDENYHFTPESMRQEFLKSSPHRSHCFRCKCLLKGYLALSFLPGTTLNDKGIYDKN